MSPTNDLVSRGGGMVGSGKAHGCVPKEVPLRVIFNHFDALSRDMPSSVDGHGSNVSLCQTPNTC